MTLDKFFGPGDRRRIEEAVREAERESAGEIVPYAVERSDAYAAAGWRAATLGSALGGVVAAAAFRLLDLWGAPLEIWIVAPAALGAAAGYLLASVSDPVRRRFVSTAEMAERVSERADEAFLEQEVFATRERTGILLFVSLFERRVVVRADRGIAARVEQSQWDAVVERIVAGIREGKPGESLARGISDCGDILARHGVERRADDRDELADGLRTGEP